MVRMGGCAGLQYSFDIDDKEIPGDMEVKDGDEVLCRIDPVSIPYLDGSTIEFVEEPFRELLQNISLPEADLVTCITTHGGLGSLQQAFRYSQPLHIEGVSPNYACLEAAISQVVPDEGPRSRALEDARRLDTWYKHAGQSTTGEGRADPLVVHAEGCVARLGELKTAHTMLYLWYHNKTGGAGALALALLTSVFHKILQKESGVLVALENRMLKSIVTRVEHVDEDQLRVYSDIAEAALIAEVNSDLLASLALPYPNFPPMPYPLLTALAQALVTKGRATIGTRSGDSSRATRAARELSGPLFAQEPDVQNLLISCQVVVQLSMLRTDHPSVPYLKGVDDYVSKIGGLLNSGTVPLERAEELLVSLPPALMAFIGVDGLRDKVEHAHNLGKAWETLTRTGLGQDTWGLGLTKSDTVGSWYENACLQSGQALLAIENCLEGSLSLRLRVQAGSRTDERSNAWTQPVISAHHELLHMQALAEQADSAEGKGALVHALSQFMKVELEENTSSLVRKVLSEARALGCGHALNSGDVERHFKSQMTEGMTKLGLIGTDVTMGRDYSLPINVLPIFTALASMAEQASVFDLKERQEKEEAYLALKEAQEALEEDDMMALEDAEEDEGAQERAALLEEMERERAEGPLPMPSPTSSLIAFFTDLYGGEDADEKLNRLASDNESLKEVYDHFRSNEPLYSGLAEELGSTPPTMEHFLDSISGRNSDTRVKVTQALLTTATSFDLMHYQLSTGSDESQDAILQITHFFNSGAPIKVTLDGISINNITPLELEDLCAKASLVAGDEAYKIVQKFADFRGRVERLVPRLLAIRDTAAFCDRTMEPYRSDVEVRVGNEGDLSANLEEVEDFMAKHRRVQDELFDICPALSLMPPHMLASLLRDVSTNMIAEVPLERVRTRLMFAGIDSAVLNSTDAATSAVPLERVRERVTALRTDYIQPLEVNKLNLACIKVDEESIRSTLSDIVSAYAMPPACILVCSESVTEADVLEFVGRWKRSAALINTAFVLVQPELLQEGVRKVLVDVLANGLVKPYDAPFILLAPRRADTSEMDSFLNKEFRAKGHGAPVEAEAPPADAPMDLEGEAEGGEADVEGAAEESPETSDLGVMEVDDTSSHVDLLSRIDIGISPHAASGKTLAINKLYTDTREDGDILEDIMVDATTSYSELVHILAQGVAAMRGHVRMDSTRVFRINIASQGASVLFSSVVLQLCVCGMVANTSDDVFESRGARFLVEYAVNIEPCGIMLPGNTEELRVIPLPDRLPMTDMARSLMSYVECMSQAAADPIARASMYRGASQLGVYDRKVQNSMDITGQLNLFLDNHCGILNFEPLTLAETAMFIRFITPLLPFRPDMDKTPDQCKIRALTQASWENICKYLDKGLERYNVPFAYIHLLAMFNMVYSLVKQDDLRKSLIATRGFPLVVFPRVLGVTTQSNGRASQPPAGVTRIVIPGKNRGAEVEHFVNMLDRKWKYMRPEVQYNLNINGYTGLWGKNPVFKDCIRQLLRACGLRREAVFERLKEEGADISSFTLEDIEASLAPGDPFVGRAKAVWEKHASHQGRRVQALRQLAEEFYTELLSPSDQLLSRFAWTDDNFFLLVATYCRLAAGVPVIFRGDTGIGKTLNMRMLAHLSGWQLATLTLHAGFTKEKLVEEIFEKPNSAGKLALSNIPVILFLDEANVSPHLYALKGLITDRVFCGHKLPDQVRIVAATNPYKRKTKEEMDRLKLVGLAPPGGVSLDGDSDLVYRVFKLPQSLEGYVWDLSTQLTQNEDETPEQFRKRKNSHRNRRKRAENTYITAILDKNLGLPPQSPEDAEEPYPGYKEIRSRYVKSLCDIQNTVRESLMNEGAASLRDIQRNAVLFRHFYNLHHRRVEDGGQCKSNPLPLPLIAALAIHVSHGLHFGMRSSFLDALIGTKGLNVARQDYISAIEMATDYWVDQIKVPVDICANQALAENIFAICTCATLKIPIVIVGPPGCSKNLALSLIEESRVLKLVPFRFQCSKFTTPDAIAHIFKRAGDQVESASKAGTIPIVVLDEIGVADLSVHRPLKVLHDRLENPQMAFVAFSNWSLDYAKLNRTLLLTRHNPSEDDYRRTAAVLLGELAMGVTLPGSDLRLNSIAFNAYNVAHSGYKNEADGDGDGALSQTMSQDIEMDGGASQRHKERRERKTRLREDAHGFFGLRDFYAVCLYIRKELKRVGEERGVTHGKDFPLDVVTDVIVSAFRRNFSGKKDKADRLVCEALIQHAFHTIGPAAGRIPAPRPLSHLVHDAVVDYESRNVLIRESVEGMWQPLLREALSPQERAKVEYFVYSDLNGDQATGASIQELIRLRSAMKSGRIAVLCGADHLHESLLDVLNRRFYTDANGQQSARLAFGAQSRDTPVHKQFRVIAVSSTEDVVMAPVISRFEKYRADPSCLSSSHSRDWETYGHLIPFYHPNVTPASLGAIGIEPVDLLPPSLALKMLTDSSKTLSNLSKEERDRVVRRVTRHRSAVSVLRERTGAPTDPCLTVLLTGDAFNQVALRRELAKHPSTQGTRVVDLTHVHASLSLLEEPSVPIVVYAEPAAVSSARIRHAMVLLARRGNAVLAIQAPRAGREDRLGSTRQFHLAVPPVDLPIQVMYSDSLTDEPFQFLGEALMHDNVPERLHELVPGRDHVEGEAESDGVQCMWDADSEMPPPVRSVLISALSSSGAKSVVQDDMYRTILTTFVDRPELRHAVWQRAVSEASMAGMLHRDTTDACVGLAARVHQTERDADKGSQTQRSLSSSVLRVACEILEPFLRKTIIACLEHQGWPSIATPSDPFYHVACSLVNCDMRDLVKLRHKAKAGAMLPGGRASPASTRVELESMPSESPFPFWRGIIGPLLSVTREDRDSMVLSERIESVSQRVHNISGSLGFLVSPMPSQQKAKKAKKSKKSKKSKKTKDAVETLDISTSFLHALIEEASLRTLGAGEAVSVTDLYNALIGAVCMLVDVPRCEVTPLAVVVVWTMAQRKVTALLSAPCRLGCLDSLSTLEYLYLDANHIDGQIPSCVGDMASLREFHSTCNNLTGSVPLGFDDLPHLEEVRVQCNLALECTPLTSDIIYLCGEDAEVCQECPPTPVGCPPTIEIDGCGTYALVNEDPRSSYVETEDGTLLHYYRRDLSTDPRPVLLVITPYDAMTAVSSDTVLSLFPGVEESTHIVGMDIRGKGLSTGSFDAWAQAPTDVAAVIEDIMSQSWSDLGVITAGCSGDGIGQYLSLAVDPVITAMDDVIGQATCVATGDLVGWVTQGGSFRQYATYTWLTSIGEPQFLQTLLEALMSGDPSAVPGGGIKMTEEGCSAVTWPSVHVTGAYDMFQRYSLDAYECYKDNVSAPLSAATYLVMDYGGHCTVDEEGVQERGGASTGMYLGNVIAGCITEVAVARSLTTWDPLALTMLDMCVQGVGGAYLSSLNPGAVPPTIRQAQVWVHSLGMGVGRAWYTCDWPVQAEHTPVPLYPFSGSPSLSFEHNPLAPRVTVGGHTFAYETCGAWTQPPTNTDPDTGMGDQVDVYIDTDSVSDLATLMGRVGAQIRVRVSTATDLDLHVALSEVDAQGGRVLLTRGVTRLSLASGTPSPVIPGEWLVVPVDLWNVSWSLQPHATLHLSIAASNSPMYPVYGAPTVVEVDTTASVLVLPFTDMDDSCDLIVHYGE
ncbi:hypothetical protein KIPB_001113 [Kipferlia bialata]|uniref:Uncharacterized protein n=1 Tax=Kipferlia bialata TaxID=797122 RepID=A0A9K3CQ86_9EUKA|nr:hypothetical protein KIPB_001113 [Kipferlia bialata]|eukprot:g1113.t1